MGRVVIEAQLRGRPVLGANVGGIPDLVTDGVDGVLFPPDAIDLSVLNDRAELERLAANARAAGERMLATADDYAGRMRELVES
jgi:glycosyltransferase involved in cell wall biosynthesis